jgi:hypothetical protein
MKIDEIVKKLEKGGFKQSRAYHIVNINADGGYLVGDYLGTVDFENEDGETKQNHKFKVVEGMGLLKQDSKAVEAIEKDEEIVIFGSGLLNWILANKHKVGERVAIVYKGMDSFKRGKKVVKAHQHEVMAYEGK